MKAVTEMATVETFQIKTEGRPQRCEICHQDDLFDPLSGHCGRCSGIVPANAVNLAFPNAGEPEGRRWPNVVSLLGSGTLGLIGFGLLIQVCLTVAYRPNLLGILFLLGIIAFAGFGYYLCYCYLLLVLGEMDTPERRWVGKATLLYNLVVFIASALFLLQVSVTNLFTWGIITLWFGWLVYMLGFGGFLITREPIRENLPPELN